MFFELFQPGSCDAFGRHFVWINALLSQCLPCRVEEAICSCAEELGNEGGRVLRAELCRTWVPSSLAGTVSKTALQEWFP